MKANSALPRVFISHSSKDKDFVRRLVDDLKSREIEVWLDERELKAGDSIVNGISDGLKDTDYLVVVLSKASTESRWVQAELNTVLMEQLSGKGVVVLPLLIENCDIPLLLKERVYADFRQDYDAGLNSLLDVLRQEHSTLPADRDDEQNKDCFDRISSLSDADLRRLINAKAQRQQVGMLWFDTLGDDMEDHLPRVNKLQCIIQLLIEVNHRGLRNKLITNLCKDMAYIINP